MNLLDYKKELGTDAKASVPSSVSFVLPETSFKTDPVKVSVNTSNLGKELEYSFKEIIPDDANVISKNVIIYGDLNGNKRIAHASNKLTERVVIDNKYEKPEIKVQIEYERNNKLYTIEQSEPVQTTSFIKFDVKEPEISSKSTEEVVAYLINRVINLETELKDLRSLISK